MPLSKGRDVSVEVNWVDVADNSWPKPDSRTTVRASHSCEPTAWRTFFVGGFHVLEIFADVFNDFRPCDECFASPVIWNSNEMSAHARMEVYVLYAPIKKSRVSPQ